MCLCQPVQLCFQLLLSSGPFFLLHQHSEYFHQVLLSTHFPQQHSNTTVYFLQLFQPSLVEFLFLKHFVFEHFEQESLDSQVEQTGVEQPIL